VDDFYAKNPDYRIIHNNLDDMNKVTTIQTYQKGSWTLHMLRGILGDEVFWKGIRIYYSKYMNGHATTADFIRTMEETSGQNLKTFFDQWLYKPGTLKIKGSWHYDATRKELVMQLNQTQTDGSVFTMPIQADIQQAGKQIRKTITLTGKSNTISVPLDTAPTEITLDPDHWVLMDAVLTAAATK
jgi:VCBS repeat-containing protein